jgi:hypothetical protein
LVLLVVPWTFVGWLWWGVAHDTTLGQLLWAVGLVFVLAAMSLCVNFAWILHNVRIFKRKGPRKGLPASDLDYRQDWAGRPVEADWPSVRAAQVVVVFPTPEAKMFLPDEAVPGDARDLVASVGETAAP